nr:hypothetical protein CFP56_64710 [Quercus suber]
MDEPLSDTNATHGKAQLLPERTDPNFDDGTRAVTVIDSAASSGSNATVESPSCSVDHPQYVADGTGEDLMTFDTLRTLDSNDHWFHPASQFQQSIDGPGPSLGGFSPSSVVRFHDPEEIDSFLDRMFSSPAHTSCHRYRPQVDSRHFAALNVSVHRWLEDRCVARYQRARFDRIDCIETNRNAASNS